MGFMFEPAVKAEAQQWIQERMIQLKTELENSLPFAMDPVVYDFEINDEGSLAEFVNDGKMPGSYHLLVSPKNIRREPKDLSPMTRVELEDLGQSFYESPPGENTDNDESAALLLGQLLPRSSQNQTENVLQQDILQHF